MMATSAAPLRSASAHCDGTVNESSYLPWREPFVKPHTKAAVFRYCTIDMRSLAKVSVRRHRARFRKRTLQVHTARWASIADAILLRRRTLLMETFSRFTPADFTRAKNDDAFALPL